MTSTFAQMLVTNAMDATRISDGKLVSLKRVKSSSQEIVIASLLSSEELRSDPRNHCVPILDAIVDTEDPALSFIVMPFLRHVDDPPLDTVGSVLECMEQLLEVSLSFLSLDLLLRPSRASLSFMSTMLPTGE